uniref:Uncharacterized protein n=1 Tax=Panagrolaimus sp. JU765 TaxID=591449 RepID=A0AC34QPT9_9BILA
MRRSNSGQRQRQSRSTESPGVRRRLPYPYDQKRISPLSMNLAPTAVTAAFDNPTIGAAVRQFIEDVLKKGIIGLQKEFSTFSTIENKLTRVPQNSQTITKFRYKDVQCIDKSRVVLYFLSGYGDFIHANWVRSDLFESAFICTQGPLENTAGDFWRMIWQEKVVNIFMLCNIVENNIDKCFQYWPKNTGETKTFLNVLTIKCEGITDPDVNMRHTNLSIAFRGEIRYAVHIQWHTWPDKFVPQNPVPAFKLLAISRATRTPTVVHCSAGIGRTGTLVTLELLQQNLLHGIAPNLRSLIAEVRFQRAQAVQTEDQFIFCTFTMITKLKHHGLMSEKEYTPLLTGYNDYIKSLTTLPSSGTLPQRSLKKNKTTQQSDESSIERHPPKSSTPTSNSKENILPTIKRKKKQVAIKIRVGKRKSISKEETTSRSEQHRLISSQTSVGCSSEDVAKVHSPQNNSNECSKNSVKSPAVKSVFLNPHLANDEKKHCYAKSSSTSKQQSNDINSEYITSGNPTSPNSQRSPISSSSGRKKINLKSKLS